MPQAAIGPIASLAMGGLGEIGNLTGGKQQAKAASALQGAQANELNWMQNYQNMLANMSPGQMSQMLSQLTQPLNANLTTAVTNAVNPQLAAMGLGQSAGQLAAGTATALAPYQQQQQQLGAQLLGQKLYGPLQPAESVLNATTNLPSYFQQNQGAGNLLLQGIQGLTKGGGYVPSLPSPSAQIPWPSGGSGPLSAGGIGDILNNSGNLFAGFQSPGGP